MNDRPSVSSTDDIALDAPDRPYARAGGPPPADRRNHLLVYGLLLTIAMIAVPVLTYTGLRALLDSRDGEVIDPQLDPSQPGYQALVSPSPTLAVVHVGPEGELVGVAMLALAGQDDRGGSVLLVPPATVASVPEFGDLTLEYVQHANGTDTTVSLTEWILRTGIDEIVEVDHDDWAEMTRPFGGLTLTNPDELRSPDGEVVFPAGRRTLLPEEIGPYLAFLESDETALNQILRQELVWDALLRAVAAEPDTASFAGEQDRGLARFVPGLAAGTRRIAALPVTVDQVPTLEGPAAFYPDEQAIAALIPRLVPFPAGGRPGDRPLVRVLDGSQRPEVLTPAVRLVARAGGQVVMIGNADEFGVEATRLLVADDALIGLAESVAAELGVGSVQRIDYIDENAELIVVLGADFHPPPQLR